MKPNISILIYSLAAGGAERVVSLLIERLKDKYNIILVLMNDTIFYKVSEDIKIIYIKNSNPNESGVRKFLKLPFLGWKYKKNLKQEKIDISLSFMYRPNYISVFAKLFGAKTRIIISERATPSILYKEALQGKVNKFLIRWLYRKADEVIANSKGNKKDLEENFRVKNIKVIYNPIDLEIINNLKQEPINLQKDKFTFVTIGRLDQGKNHALLIDAIKDIDATLWIIGDGPLRKDLEKKIRDLKLEDKVKILGRQKNPYKFLSKADCFVFSSNYEGFPNVLLEALACELPIISTDCRSGPRELLAPDTDINKEAKDIEIAKYGILVPVGNTKKMSRAMKLIMEDDELRESFRRKALNRAKDFEIDKIITQWEELIGGY